MSRYHEYIVTVLFQLLCNSVLVTLSASYLQIFLPSLLENSWFVLRNIKVTEFKSIMETDCSHTEIVAVFLS